MRQKETVMKNPVLVVGAGPTGLVLALNLARRGVPFRIIDKNKGPGLASRAMAVHARTLEFYRQMGFADEVVAKGIKIDTVHLRENAQEVAKLTLKDMGKDLSPYPFVLSFPQDDHERFLVGKLNDAGVDVEWETALEGFTQDEQGVHAQLDRSGTKETVDASYLCGCDGAHSRVRETLKLGFEGGTYAHRYYVADAKLSGKTDTDAYINIGDDTFALRLPVRSTGMHRLIGMTPDSLDGKETIDFDDIRPTAERLLGVEVAEVNWFSIYRVHHRVADHFKVGRCFLAGDAGHLHSPAGGQGMNTGIGDAVNLSWKLAEVMLGRAAPALLDTYEPERIAFARTLVATTDRVFSLIVSGGVGGQILRSVLVPHVLPFLSGFATARRVMFKTVSQTRINYENSALSEGKAGDIEGGDRLPWVFNAGRDNFDALNSAGWQLHIYGKIERMLASEAEKLGLAVHRFDWSEVAEHAGLKQDAAYLVRPDGYVALALAKPTAEALTAFVGKFSLTFEKR